MKILPCRKYVADGNYTSNIKDHVFLASDQYHQTIKFPHIKNAHEIYSVEFFAIKAKLPIMAMLTSKVFTRAKKITSRFF